MKNFEDLDDVAQFLGDNGPFNPDVEFDTVEELVDALVSIGNTDKVYAFHDEHLGLKDDLPRAFLNSSLSDIDDIKFEVAIEAVLEQANTIIPLSTRLLSEDDLEAIEEDRISRGLDSDD
ncbi:hypothetical protein AO724_06490 [Aeromonas allosaccharophila]|uniref:hypothetical protein n=1 Tax=Aeromonas allosaccharophila TaxID=656 RepID=UPI000717E29B|nr:hypothetical protein [Aeromonas allosaccharophila]KRW52579.1 hypothetical protein AO724_06490 [Aeromonas allosaccharophila]